jgi:hypothetical protein
LLGAPAVETARCRVEGIGRAHRHLELRNLHLKVEQIGAEAGVRRHAERDAQRLGDLLQEASKWNVDGQRQLTAYVEQTEHVVVGDLDVLLNERRHRRHILQHAEVHALSDGEIEAGHLVAFAEGLVEQRHGLMELITRLRIDRPDLRIDPDVDTDVEIEGGHEVGPLRGHAGTATDTALQPTVRLEAGEVLTNERPGYVIQRQRERLARGHHRTIHPGNCVGIEKELDTAQIGAGQPRGQIQAACHRGGLGDLGADLIVPCRQWRIRSRPGAKAGADVDGCWRDVRPARQIVDVIDGPLGFGAEDAAAIVDAVADVDHAGSGAAGDTSTGKADVATVNAFAARG